MPVGRKKVFINLMSIHIFCLSFVQCCVSYVLFGTEYLAIATFQTSGYNKFIFYKHARKQSVPYKHDIPSTQRLILTHCRHSFSLIATPVVCDFARLLLWTCHRKSDLVSLISSQERVRRRSWFSPVVPRSALMSKRGKLLPTVFRGFSFWHRLPHAVFVLYHKTWFGSLTLAD